MTRETRIGLIVGLAFIVLFGIVLSELGPSGEAPQEKPDRMSRGFYSRAPVTPPTQQRPEELPLVAQRRPDSRRPTTAAAGGAQQPPLRQQPARAAEGAQRPPLRVVGQRTVAPIPGGRPAGSGEGTEMTAEEFAASHGVRTDHSRMYVTRSGDNLTAIARKFYRTPSRKAVMKIFNANRNVLQTPDALGVGVKIVIPN